MSPPTMTSVVISEVLLLLLVGLIVLVTVEAAFELDESVVVGDMVVTRNKNGGSSLTMEAMEYLAARTVKYSPKIMPKHLSLSPPTPSVSEGVTASRTFARHMLGEVVTR